MDEDLQARLEAIAAGAGFRTAGPYCSQREMLQGIRELSVAAETAPLSDVQRLALLENLRRIIVKTAPAPSSGPSVAAQSGLPRWRRLREASLPAAAAYAAVLGYLELAVPQCLTEEPDDDRTH